MRALIQWVSMIATGLSGFVIGSQHPGDIDVNSYVFFAGSVIVLSATILAGGKDDD